MDYSQKLKYHFRPEIGWINDPNGLVFFDGYYHIFFQYKPHYKISRAYQFVHWGHARTKDFLHWEELPIALYPDTDYDGGGCWSGTAIVRDGVLYLFYASVLPCPGKDGPFIQKMSVAYSRDGIHFEKYERNPVIDHYPSDGSPDFRDPAVCEVNGTYFCVMASGNSETKTGRLLLYRSDDLFTWDYVGVMSEWANCHFTECPSLVSAGEQYLLSASVLPREGRHYFTMMFGSFDKGKFKAEHVSEVDKGPDGYAGQIFTDHKGRNILITWIPGWGYRDLHPWDISCLSLPREVKLEDGVITAFPIEEVRHLLVDEDPAVKRTETGFVVERSGRESLVYEGRIDDIKILRDEFVVEIYINGGRENYMVLL